MFKVHQLVYIERILIGGENNVYDIQQKCKELNLHFLVTEYPTITISTKVQPVVKLKIDLHTYNFNFLVCAYDLNEICSTVNRMLIILNVPKRVKRFKENIYILNDDSSFVKGIVYDSFDSNTMFNINKGNKFNVNKINRDIRCNDCKYFGNNPYIYCSISPFGFNNTGCVYTPNE